MELVGHQQVANMVFSKFRILLLVMGFAGTACQDWNRSEVRTADGLSEKSDQQPIEALLELSKGMNYPGAVTNPNLEKMAHAGLAVFSDKVIEFSKNNAITIGRNSDTSEYRLMAAFTKARIYQVLDKATGGENCLLAKGGRERVERLRRFFLWSASSSNAIGDLSEILALNPTVGKENYVSWVDGAVMGGIQTKVQSRELGQALALKGLRNALSTTFSSYWNLGFMLNGQKPQCDFKESDYRNHHAYQSTLSVLHRET